LINLSVDIAAMETKPDLQTLMARKLEGTITPNELVALQAMVFASPKVAKEFEELEKIWKTSQKLSIPTGIQQDARWQHLQSKIADANRTIAVDTPAPKSRTLLWPRYAAAAAVIATLVVVYLVNNNNWVTITTRADEARSITLPDSSIVRLEGNAVLSYDVSQWNSKRNLRLTGNAFFEVRRTGTSFVVESTHARVAVLGTSFRVNSSGQQTVVACFTGKVSVANKKALQEVILTPGLETVIKDDVVSAPYTSAMPQLVEDLNFHRAPLLTVFESLASHHNKHIVIPSDVDSVSFTGNLRDASLESALKTVCLSAGLKFTISADSVFIKSR
jgi:transmembrane sensor